MKLPYEFALGWRYLLGGRGRNGFVAFIGAASMVGIALGVTALIVVLSVWNGFQKEVLDRMLSVVAHVELLSPTGSMPDWANRLEQVRQQSGIKAVAPFVSAQALLARGEDMKGVEVRGIAPSLEPALSPVLQKVDLTALTSGSYQAILGAELAKGLGVGVGDSLTLVVPRSDGASLSPRYQKITVAGSFTSGHYEFDSSLVMMNLADTQAVFELPAPSGLRIALNEPRNSRVTARALSELFDHQLLVRDWTQRDRQWFTALQHQKRMMFIILALIVAVAAFNLVSTLVMTVTDKRADIAILRTLGASPRSIMLVFMVQGALVGVMGTLLGIVFGLGVAWNIDIIIPALEHVLHMRFIPADIYRIDHMPSDPQSGDILPITLIALALAFVSTLYPSWRASRVNPAEALRYE